MGALVWTSDHRITANRNGRRYSSNLTVGTYAIADLPDSAAAVALTLAVNQSGGATTKTVVLITPDEMDNTAKKAVSYRPPGH